MILPNYLTNLQFVEHPDIISARPRIRSKPLVEGFWPLAVTKALKARKAGQNPCCCSPLLSQSVRTIILNDSTQKLKMQ